MTAESTQIISWLIAGTIASWLAYERAGRGPMGLVVDWLVGLTGALLAVVILPFIAWLITFIVHLGQTAPFDWGQSVLKFEWWFAIPTAFLGGLLFTKLFRKIA